MESLQQLIEQTIEEVLARLKEENLRPDDLTIHEPMAKDDDNTTMAAVNLSPGGQKE